jgi:hypothetical protein
MGCSCMGHVGSAGRQEELIAVMIKLATTPCAGCPAIYPPNPNQKKTHTKKTRTTTPLSWPSCPRRRQRALPGPRPKHGHACAGAVGAVRSLHTAGAGRGGPHEASAAEQGAAALSFWDLPPSLPGTAVGVAAPAGRQTRGEGEGEGSLSLLGGFGEAHMKRVPLDKVGGPLRFFSLFLPFFPGVLPRLYVGKPGRAGPHGMRAGERGQAAFPFLLLCSPFLGRAWMPKPTRRPLPFTKWGVFFGQGR